MKSPFKFLDSYTKDDRDIFFGRDREIEELYQKVFDSKLLLVYGVSGTGKSSLIHCGLANKFSETDWLPLVVRRGSNIIDSTASAIKSASVTPQEGHFSTPSQFKKGVRSLYLDHYKPVFFIFDQFEELFIFGDKEERKSFVQIIKSLIESDLQCRLIFVMREEYMAGITEFEKFIPTFFSNRVRIEKMSHINAIDAITKPCKVYNINLEEGFAEALLEKLSPDQSDVELTYLQVFLDKIFRSSTDDFRLENESNQIIFSLSLLNKTGNVSDLLGSFLDEQVALLGDPTTGLTILKCFVSLKGTRKQISEQEISVTSLTFGKDISENVLQDYLHQFTNLRILKEKNEEGKYELRHDALADKIFGKISMMEKELLEVLNFLETANQQFDKRGAYLSESDLKYIQYFDDKQIFKNNQKFSELIELSKKYHSKEKRKRRQLVTSLAIGLIIILGTLSIWAISQRGKAIIQKNIAETQKNEAIAAKQEAQVAKEIADKAREEADNQKINAETSEKTAQIERNKALNAKTLAENELYKNIKNSLSVSAEKMNVLYLGIGNPIKIAVSGIPNNKLVVSCDNGSIIRAPVTDSLKNSELFIASPFDLKPVNIIVYAEIKPAKNEYIGTKTFRVKPTPSPYATFADKSSGTILKEKALATRELISKIDMDFDAEFSIAEFTVLYSSNLGDFEAWSNSNFLTNKQLDLISRLEHKKYLTFKDIKTKTPDGKVFELPPIILKIYDPKIALTSDNDSLIYVTALEFFNEGNLFKSSEKKLFFNHSIELFEAIKIRKLPDLFGELRSLAVYSTIDFSPDIDRKLKRIKTNILTYEWNNNKIDSLFNINQNLSFVWNGNILNNKSLEFPEFLIQLMNKINVVPDISNNQKKSVSSFCESLGNQQFYNKLYKSSLDFYVLGIKCDSTNKYISMRLPSVYVLNDMYKEAELQYLKLKDKIYDEDLSRTFSYYFLSELEYFERVGIKHPDFEKVKRILNK